MANIDTPGYQAVGMDFEEEMRSALSDVDRGVGPRRVQVRVVDGLIARPDGNDVSMDRESLNLAEAQLRFKTGVALLREEDQRVMDAIHADSK
jgi:flagellar basal-body rod protein FlgB